MNNQSPPTPEVDPNAGVDVSKIDRATIKQLRKNIEKLKSMKNVDDLKKTTHFDIRSFFPIGKK